MEYYKVLHLHKEPFSNSPDPELFFQSRQHLGCLQKLELSLRLRRGLNVVIGDVGTGKTTLCRQLIRRLAGDKNIDTHLILDPFFKSASESLHTIAGMLGGSRLSEDMGDRDIKENIKQFLFQKGVAEKRTVVLIIDEGQKIPAFFMEILREFLNYETNEHKLLQIVIFAQKEFEEILSDHANFADRISLFFLLKPMNFNDMKNMIRFRLKQAGGEEEAHRIFSRPALWEIYRASGGYPRKIISLCHQGILMMIIQNRSCVGWSLIRTSARRALYGRASSRRTSAGLPKGIAMILMGGLIGFCTAVLLIFFASGHVDFSLSRLHDSPETEMISEDIPESGKVFHRDESVKAEKAVRILPEELGQLTVRQGETLGQLLRMVYGTASPDIMDQVIEKNPHIGNPHRISVGQRIYFPAIVQSSEKIPLNGYFIERGSFDSLEPAMESLRSAMNDRQEAMRLIPYLDLQGKLKFSIIMDEYFPDESSARLRAGEQGSESGIKSFDSWKGQKAVFGNFTG